MPALARHGRPHEGRDRRAQAVGADHDPGAHGLLAAVRVLEDGALHPPAGAADEVGEPDAVAHVGARLDRRVHENAVEHRAAGREERRGRRPGA